MVLDLLDNSGLEPTLGEKFLLAFRFLRSLPADLPEGRVDLEQSDAFALIQGYATKVADSKKFEAHERYADVHFLLEGEELMEYAPISTLTATGPYDAEKDCRLFTGTSKQSLVLRPGYFVVFFPQDGHKPGCQLDGPIPVRKIVVKVPLRT